MDDEHSEQSGQRDAIVRGDHRDEQAVFGELDLINQHPFGKWQQWGPFHHTLASQAKRHSRGFSWKGV